MESEVAYKSRPEWRDVKPIFHSETEKAVVPINYSPEFEEVFAYFRAVLQSEEKSERAFQLTTAAVRLNPANYTAWQYRRILLQHLKKDLSEEMEFIAQVIEDNPKNYQVWHHRKSLVELTKNADGELTLTENVLKDDSKNYHAWQHRQWVVRAFQLWEKELELAGHLLAEDLRNNSAWNYRYFVITNTTGFTTDVLDREVKIALEFAKRAPHNESVWNYLNGILLEQGVGTQEGVWEACEAMFGEGCRAPYLLSFMVDCLLDRKDKEADSKAARDYMERAKALLKELETVDPIRWRYWKRLQEVGEK